MGVVSATIGAGLLGMGADMMAADAAMDANERQQARALKMQEKTFKIREKYLKDSKIDAVRAGTRLATKSIGDARARMADRGIDPTGSIGLGYERAAYRGAADAAQQLEFQYGKALSDVRSNASYPMIMQQPTTGNAGALASAVAGGFMAQGMTGMSSQAASGMANTIAGQMAQNLPSQMASTNYSQYMPF